MEHTPESQESTPSLQSLFKAVMDEEYSAFFVCNDEYTAGMVEMAASDTDTGRAELIDMVARNAVESPYVGQVDSFLYGGIAFIKGTQPEMLDVNENRISSTLTHWYIRLTRQDIRYLYVQDSGTAIEKAFPISVRTSMKR